MTKLLVCVPLVLLACKHGDASPKTKPAPAPAPTAPAQAATAATRVQIDVTEKGFEPGDVTVPANKQVTLVFDRKTDETCAKQVVLDLGDGHKVEKDLPLNTPVEIAATFPKAGKLTYACGMNMETGTITVQ